MLTKEIVLENGVSCHISFDEEQFPIAIGGTRLISGSDKREAELLAQAMSYKLHSYGLPMSGAKAVIDSDEISDFHRFVAHETVADHLTGRDTPQLITGPDIGTSEQEYYRALEAAGMDALIRPGLLSEMSETYNLPMDNIVTAYGVVVACEELVRIEKTGDPLENKRICIEGFGKVGTGIARIIEGRAKLVAVSTKYGTIVNPEGFAIPKLLDLQETHGDRFITHVTEEILSTEQLFSVPADIIIPGARTESVNLEIANRLLRNRPKAVVPVSNYPYTSDALDLLHDAGILAFPDFISSAGAIIASMIEFASAGDQTDALDLVHEAVTAETRQLILAARACTDHTRSIYQIAIDRASLEKKRLLEGYTEHTSMKNIARTVIKRYLPHLLDT